MTIELTGVLGIAAAGEDAAVDGGMERLHPPPEQLWEARDVRDLADGEARRGEGTGGPTRRDQLDAERRKTPAERLEPGLVEHREEGAPHRTGVGHDVPWNRTRRPSITTRPSATRRIASG